MTKLRILGVAALAVAMAAPDAIAQRRGGGAVRGGMRGAMVGGFMGGSSGAQTGAKVGAVAGATRGAAQRAEYRAAQRNAMEAETQTRAQYQASMEYQSAQHSNFNETPPEGIVASRSAGAAVSGREAVIRSGGRPILGISYPSDWKQKAGDRFIFAVSADGQAWSAIGTLEGIRDRQAGIERIKQGLAKYLQNIEYDKLIKTERGALVVTGTGTGKKAGVDVVFAAGVFDSGEGQLSGAAFIVDADVEEHYKETVRYICQTIRGEQDFEQ